MFYEYSLIVSGLQTVIAIRETIEDLIANQSTSDNEECINEATSTWPENLETTGDDIAACSEEHVYTIFHEIQVFHTYIEEQNKAAFNVYNLVLNLFDNVKDLKRFDGQNIFDRVFLLSFQLNPLTSAGEITPAINAQIDEINNEFEGTIRPEIERHLTFISNMRLSIPGEIHRCVDTAVSRCVVLEVFSESFNLLSKNYFIFRLNNESIDVYHAVDAC